jgi:hypothetical protein
MVGVELSSGRADSSMIELSVRCAVPLLFVAFAASSVNVLFPIFLMMLGAWLILKSRGQTGYSHQPILSFGHIDSLAVLCELRLVLY